MAIGATKPPRLPIMFMLPENVPANRPPTSMHAPHAQGRTKSLNMPGERDEQGQRERVRGRVAASRHPGGGHEAEGGERAARACHAADPPARATAAEAGDERAETATEQRQAGEHGQHHGPEQRVRACARGTSGTSVT